MLAEWFVGFVDGSCHHTCNLASAPWVIYSLSGQLVASRGACLCPATNNVDEYKVIELLWDVVSCVITHLEVRLNSQLMFSQLNGDYQVRKPTLFS